MTEQAKVYTFDDEPMHDWFSLSYSNYLVLRRSVIQSMPADWQRRLRDCLIEATEAFGYIENESEAVSFRVSAMNHSGRFVRDPYADYERGRRRLKPRPVDETASDSDSLAQAASQANPKT